MKIAVFYLKPQAVEIKVTINDNNPKFLYLILKIEIYKNINCIGN